jgi:hypothetical protein
MQITIYWPSRQKYNKSGNVKRIIPWRYYRAICSQTIQLCQLQCPRLLLGEHTLREVEDYTSKGKVKDYYDVWKLTAIKTINKRKVRSSFIEKCKSKNVEFTKVDDLFPPDLLAKLTNYYDVGLARLTSEPMPPLQTMLDELRTRIRDIIE